MARWYAPAWGPKSQLPGVVGKLGPVLPNGWKKVGVWLMGTFGRSRSVLCDEPVKTLAEDCVWIHHPFLLIEEFECR